MGGGGGGKSLLIGPPITQVMEYSSGGASAKMKTLFRRIDTQKVPLKNIFVSDIFFFGAKVLLGAY